MNLTALYWFIAAFVVFALGLLMDMPEQRRRQKQKIKCASGEHDFKDWEFQYEIHNGNDVWDRHCKFCGAKETTVSKLTPKK